MEYNCKYYKRKKQVSYDSGVTWYDVTPMEYQKGDLYEYQSHDCPYAPHDYSQDYLTFVARENGTFKLSGNSVNYSLDSGATWTTLASDTDSPMVQSGDSIMWKATLAPNVGIGTFYSSGEFDVEGNAMSLLYGDDFSGQTSLEGKNYAFQRLFSANTNVVSAENMSLPATTLASHCYFQMFSGCTSLTTAPTVLPATTLSDGCYEEMFMACTSLTEAPELPATTLAENCYSFMFCDCASLTIAPQLAATTLAKGCYQRMFGGCTSLTEAPELQATTLAEDCYVHMFSYCSGLTEAPQLPATMLAANCYEDMFYECRSLITAPTLSATTLATECYKHMFTFCWKLNRIECLATNISASDCTYEWLYGVSSSGTFVKASSMTWPSGNSGIPNNWTVQNA